MTSNTSAANDQTITTLRTALFSALEGVRNGSLSLDKARAINDIGKTIVDSARVEVAYLEATGGGESAFIESAIGADNVPPGLPPGITGITQHRLR